MAKETSKKPNILILWGDDIGQFNISSYNLGMMGYKTSSERYAEDQEHRFGISMISDFEIW